MKTNTNTWEDLRKFFESLTDEQLKQPIIVWGEGEPGGEITYAQLIEEDMINPSGEGAEPVSAYLNFNDPHVTKEEREEIIKNEPVVVRAGEIRLTISSAKHIGSGAFEPEPFH